MRYPFLFKVINSIDVVELKKSLIHLSKPIEVQPNWFYNPVDSDFLEKYIAEKFYGMVLYPNLINLSNATGSGFHIDRLDYNFMAHRILIPLDTNFNYEWFVDGELHRYRPSLGEVLIFNNQVPHRFVLDEDNNKKREVILFSLIDPNASPFMKHFSGASSTNSASNKELDANIVAQLKLKKSD